MDTSKQDINQLNEARNMKTATVKVKNVSNGQWEQILCKLPIAKAREIGYALFKQGHLVIINEG